MQKVERQFKNCPCISLHWTVHLTGLEGATKWQCHHFCASPYLCKAAPETWPVFFECDIFWKSKQNLALRPLWFLWYDIPRGNIYWNKSNCFCRSEFFKGFIKANENSFHTPAHPVTASIALEIKFLSWTLLLEEAKILFQKEATPLPSLQSQCSAQPVHTCRLPAGRQRRQLLRISLLSLIFSCRTSPSVRFGWHQPEGLKGIRGEEGWRRAQPSEPHFIRKPG